MILLAFLFRSGDALAGWRRGRREYYRAKMFDVWCEALVPVGRNMWRGTWILGPRR